MDLAKVDEEGIVIRLSWMALEAATIWCPGLEGVDERSYVSRPPRVIDIRVWAREVVRELNREAENGDTPITRMLDAAFVEASEQGAEGVRCWGDDE